MLKKLLHQLNFSTVIEYLRLVPLLSAICCGLFAALHFMLLWGVLFNHQSVTFGSYVKAFATMFSFGLIYGLFVGFIALAIYKLAQYFITPSRKTCIVIGVVSTLFPVWRFEMPLDQGDWALFIAMVVSGGASGWVFHYLRIQKIKINLKK